MEGYNVFRAGLNWVMVVVGLFLFSCDSTNHQEVIQQSTTGSLEQHEENIDAVEVENTFVLIEGGLLQTSDFETGEAKEATVTPFYIQKNLVTVAEFSAFAKTTGYVTEAEKFGNSTVFDFDKKTWELKDGAYYLYPFGRDKPRANPLHPATQVSWNDAQAYAQWNKARLPTADEWEWAARSAGTSTTSYAWGNTMNDGKIFHANFWQGNFPDHNTQEDGYLATSPVGKFGRTLLGLSDMGGNVWQWTSDDIPPTRQEAALDPAMRKITKGGSFLCDPKVCHGFKVTGRSSSTPETGMVHTGFRCAKDSI
jgi:sulfatase modifying factor 1